MALASGEWWWLRPRPSNPADSIAVPPFANLSGDTAQAYFSDGMAEELRGALGRIAGLKVVTRTSSEKMRDADVKGAAAKLGVAHVLTGSVRKGDGMIRVSAQLIDGSNGLEQWSQSYDRPEGDAIKLQTGIADSVASALSLTLGTPYAMPIGVRRGTALDRLMSSAMGGTTDRPHWDVEGSELLLKQPDAVSSQLPIGAPLSHVRL